MQKLTLNADNASPAFRRYFGIDDNFSANLWFKPGSDKPYMFELYGQRITKGLPHFHDLEALLLTHYLIVYRGSSSVCHTQRMDTNRTYGL